MSNNILAFTGLYVVFILKDNGKRYIEYFSSHENSEAHVFVILHETHGQPEECSVQALVVSAISS